MRWKVVLAAVALLAALAVLEWPWTASGSITGVVCHVGQQCVEEEGRRRLLLLRSAAAVVGLVALGASVSRVWSRPVGASPARAGWSMSLGTGLVVGILSGVAVFFGIFGALVGALVGSMVVSGTLLLLEAMFTARVLEKVVWSTWNRDAPRAAVQVGWASTLVAWVVAWVVATHEWFADETTSALVAASVAAGLVAVLGDRWARHGRRTLAVGDRARSVGDRRGARSGEATGRRHRGGSDARSIPASEVQIDPVAAGWSEPPAVALAGSRAEYRAAARAEESRRGRRRRARPHEESEPRARRHAHRR